MTTSTPNQPDSATNGIDDTTTLVDVCAVNEVQEGSYKLVRYRGTPVAVFGNAGRFFRHRQSLPTYGLPIMQGASS